jgi:hypothetical protein
MIQKRKIPQNSGGFSGEKVTVLEREIGPKTPF